jgi:hypothetical protein
MMVDAVGGTSLSAMKARMVSLQGAAGADSGSTASPTKIAASISSTTPAASSEPTATTSPYPRGSVASENVQMATGLAKAARTNIETLNTGVSLYNGSAGVLADQDRIEALRARGGDKAVDLLIRSHQQAQQMALMMINGSSGKMAQEFTITGVPVSRTDDGAYKVGDYVQSAAGDGWSVSVKSNGQALAIANGVDVSAQVDDSSSSGFKWSTLGQSVDIEA